MADYGMLLRDHVVLKCRSLDRIFLQAYVPKLQCVGQVCIFLRCQRHARIPSSAAFGQIGAAYEKAIRRFARDHEIPVVRFEKGQDKEKTARPFIEPAAKQGGRCGQVKSPLIRSICLACGSHRERCRSCSDGP